MKSGLHSLAARYRKAFAGLPPTVWLLALTALVNRAGTMVVPFLSLYLTTALGFSKLQAAQVLFAFGVGAMVGSVLGGRLADRWNPVLVQEFSLLGGGALFFALTRLTSLPAVVAAVFLLGLINEAYRPAVMAAVARVADEDSRLRSLALLRLAINLGMTVGPALGGILAQASYHWLFIVDGLTGWCSAFLLLVLFGLGRSSLPADPSARAGHSSASPWRDSRYLAFLSVTFLFAVIFFQIMGAYPIYLKAACRADERFVGLVFMFNALVVVLVEMPLVSALEHRNLFRVAGVGALLTGAGFALMPLSASKGFILFTVVLWTLGEMFAFPFLNSLAVQLSAGRDAGAYMGLYTAVFALTLTVAPSTGLWVYDRFGAACLWGGCGIGGLLVGVLCFRFAPRRRGGVTLASTTVPIGNLRPGPLKPPRTARQAASPRPARFFADPTFHFLVVLLLAPILAVAGASVGGKGALLAGWSAALALVGAAAFRSVQRQWRRFPRIPNRRWPALPGSCLGRKLFFGVAFTGFLAAIGALAALAALVIGWWRG